MQATRRRRWLPLRPDRQEERALTRDTLPSVFFPTTTAGPSVSVQGAMALADAWACVRAIANAAACLPLHVFVRQSDGGRVRFDGPLSRLLERPAPAFTRSSLVGTLTAHLALRGNAFLGLFRDGEGEVVQLGPLDPGSVEVRVVGGIPLYVFTGPDGRRQDLTERDVIHVRTLSLDGVVGRSPVEAGRNTLGLNAALAEHAGATMANSATISGLISVEDSPSAADQVEALRQDLGKRHQGAKNAGRIGIASGAVKFTALSMSPADVELIGQRELSTREVCRIWNCPPWILGTSSGDSLTYSTTREQRQGFLDLCVNGYLVAIEEALSIRDDLLPPTGYVEFVRQAYVESDVTALADALARQVAAGILTRNEARARLNLPALAGGDALVVAEHEEVTT